MKSANRVQLHLCGEATPVGGHLGVDAGQPELAHLPLSALKQLARLAGCCAPPPLCRQPLLMQYTCSSVLRIDALQATTAHAIHMFKCVTHRCFAGNYCSCNTHAQVCYASLLLHDIAALQVKVCRSDTHVQVCYASKGCCCTTMTLPLCR